MPRKAAAKRELIEPNKGDKRYVRRKAGKFTTSQDDVSKSLSQDRRRKAKTVVKKGQGDRGDAKPQKSTGTKKKATKARR
jgi:hypothetical protein